MRNVLATVVICAALVPVGAIAQDLSEDELLELFLAQRDAYKAAVEGNTSLTRGLTLVTAEDVEIATEVEKTESAASSATDTATTEVATAETGTTTETVVSSNETATLVKMPAVSASSMRPARLSGEKPPKTMECTAPMRAQASMA